jgi:FtsP/CotA-like multicopper oxidase with cupredoxin domain
MPDPFNSRHSRRNFLASAGAGAFAFYCTIGNQKVSLSGPGALNQADKIASEVPRPPLLGPAPRAGAQQRFAARAGKTAAGTSFDPVDKLSFGRPTPQAGGKYVEYWIRAKTVKWNIVPTKRDDWHGTKIPGKTTFKAAVYQQMTPGFAEPIGSLSMPGPTLHANVGDVLVVHFQNELDDLDQAVTMHPHGVKYTPDYDGVYLGDYTRIGGFIAPGESFTYRWECMEDSVGAWPYHDHGPNHTVNTMRGMFGCLVIGERGAPRPDVENVVFFHSLIPPITGLSRGFECVNGRAYAGNSPTFRAKVGQDVAWYVIGMDNDFHDFHIHGHRWKQAAGDFTDVPVVGPNMTAIARYVEDNPGRWLYHCHVFAHQDGGMAGWYLVDP